MPGCLTDARPISSRSGRSAVSALCVKVRRPDGRRAAVTARRYVLCCHAIETPRLLLNSSTQEPENGVANASGDVGRYLLTQANQDALGLTRDPVFPYRGPQQTSGLVQTARRSLPPQDSPPSAPRS